MSLENSLFAYFMHYPKLCMCMHAYRLLAPYVIINYVINYYTSVIVTINQYFLLTENKTSYFILFFNNTKHK